MLLCGAWFTAFALVLWGTGQYVFLCLLTFCLVACKELLDLWGTISLSRLSVSNANSACYHGLGHGLPGLMCFCGAAGDRVPSRGFRVLFTYWLRHDVHFWLRAGLRQSSTCCEPIAVSIVKPTGLFCTLCGLFWACVNRVYSIARVSKSARVNVLLFHMVQSMWLHLSGTWLWAPVCAQGKLQCCIYCS